MQVEYGGSLAGALRCFNPGRTLLTCRPYRPNTASSAGKSCSDWGWGWECGAGWGAVGGRLEAKAPMLPPCGSPDCYPHR